MSRLAKVVVLLAAVVTMIISALTFYRYVESLTELDKVVCATRNIEADTRITGDMISVTRIPVRAIHPLSISDPEQVIGHYAKTTIFAGEQVISTRIINEKEDPRGVLVQLNPNERVFPIPLSLVSDFFGIMSTGDKLDAIVILHSVRQEPTVFTICGVEVLAIHSGGDGSQGVITSGARSGAVLVRVNPKQAELLAACLQNGEVYFVLQPPQAASVTRGPMRIQDLIQSEGN